MKTTLQIQNLKCGGCEKTIINKFSKLKNVTSVSVDHENATVRFEYTKDKDLEIVKKMLSKLGYPVVGEKNNLGRKATSYISCAIGRVQQ